jgi:hypothetical protein
VAASVKKIMDDFALFSGLGLRYRARGCDLAHLAVEKLLHHAAQRRLVVLTMLRSANTGSAMLSHKFHVGESVSLIPSISRNVSGGIYQVGKQLPHNGRDFEYHIKSANEHHQRVARESELTKAICSASARHLSSAAAAPRFSISDSALLILRSRLLTYS